MQSGQFLRSFLQISKKINRLIQTEEERIEKHATGASKREVRLRRKLRWIEIGPPCSANTMNRGTEKQGVTRQRDGGVACVTNGALSPRW